MALHLAPPPPARKARERFADLTKSKDDNLSLWVGLIASVALWFALLWVASLVLTHFGENHSNLATYEAPKPVFSIEMAQDEFLLPDKAPPKEKLPERFIEANPDAPENIPDETRNIGAHNQQAAQEVPTPDSKSDLPSTKGEAKEETTQIVSGSLHQPPPEDTPPPPPPSPEMMEAVREAQAQRERNPLPGDQKISGESTTGYGFNTSKATQNIEDVQESQKGTPNAPLIVAAPQASVQKVDAQRPLPRPRLERKVRPAVLADRPIGTSNMGITAADVRWSEYGAYLQRLIDAVQIEWDRILDNSKTYPPAGSIVKITFRLDQEGNVTELVNTESNAGNLGTRACQSAITSRAPYGKWTSDMVAALGEKQDLTFTFYYQ